MTPPQSPGPYLQIQGLRMEFGDIVAVHDVTLDVRQGEFLTFLGPSGSGKSTTLYILAGFQQPTKGDILLNGRTLLDRPSHQRNIGMVFQRYTLFPNMTVGENVAFPLKVRRRPKAEIDAKVREMLRLVRLEGFEDRRIAKMSGGQQQRVALARALAYDPPVLLMDEPLSALDKKLREEIQYEIRRIHQQTGVTILYVTHDQEEALRLSDRIAVFSQGRIDQVGAGAELYANPATRFVAEFIGDSDVLPAEIVAAGEGRADVRIGESVVRGVPIHGAARLGAATLLLRPERITLARGADKGESGGIRATVSDVTFLGNNFHVAAVTPRGEPLSVRLPFGHAAAASLARGETISLSFDPASAHVFC